MSEEFSHLSSELDAHKTNLDGWVTSVAALDVSPSRKGVCDRFVRDCNTLKSDIDSSEDPSSADLCDYGDRINSLEIQFHQITDPAS